MADLPTIKEIRNVFMRKKQVLEELELVKQKQLDYMHIAKIDKLHNQILVEFTKREKNLILITEALLLARKDMSEKAIECIDYKEVHKSYHKDNIQNTIANRYVTLLCKKAQKIIKDILFN